MPKNGWYKEKETDWLLEWMRGWLYLGVRVVEEAKSEQMWIIAILQRSAAEP